MPLVNHELNCFPTPWIILFREKAGELTNSKYNRAWIISGLHFQPFGKLYTDAQNRPNGFYVLQQWDKIQTRFISYSLEVQIVLIWQLHIRSSVKQYKFQQFNFHFQPAKDQYEVSASVAIQFSIDYYNFANRRQYVKKSVLKIQQKLSKKLC